MTLQEKLEEFVWDYGHTEFTESWLGIEEDFRVRLNEILRETAEAARSGIPPVQFPARNRTRDRDNGAARDGQSRSGRR